MLHAPVVGDISERGRDGNNELYFTLPWHIAGDCLSDGLLECNCARADGRK